MTFFGTDVTLYVTIKFAKSSWQFRLGGQLGVSWTGSETFVMVPPHIQTWFGPPNAVMAPEVAFAPAPTRPLSGSATSSKSVSTVTQLNGGSSLVPKSPSVPAVGPATQSAARRPRQRSRFTAV